LKKNSKFEDNYIFSLNTLSKEHSFVDLNVSIDCNLDVLL
jgi:hypothetical protein